MSINWSHLPKDVIAQVCMGGRNGCLPYEYRIATNTYSFYRDTATGWMKCTGCKKPKISNLSIQECDICENVFVPKMFDKAKMSHFGIMCDECDPPKELVNGQSAS